MTALKGAFGPKPEAEALDPNHKHGPECFAPGGT